MSLEIKIDDRTANISFLESDGAKLKIDIDGKKYNVDVVMVKKGVYSIIHKGISYNVELIENKNSKKYIVNTLYKTYDIEIIDAESKYLKRKKQDDSEDESFISSPMPGKIVKIPVKAGDKVKAGDTVIIVSAMKMESEYKVKKDRIIKDIRVKEGDIIDGDQVLVVVE
ncbi:MAG: biotin/lipoyl-binding protein [Bacteroidales bacterium]|nr:biotin/lipoyl-binding protein [Bacteroidales bacterium]